MTIIASILVFSPVVLVLFYIVYKSWLLINRKFHLNKTKLEKKKYPIIYQKDINNHFDELENTEELENITAIITAAVRTYIQKQKGEKLCH